MHAQGLFAARSFIDDEGHAPPQLNARKLVHFLCMPSFDKTKKPSANDLLAISVLHEADW